MSLRVLGSNYLWRTTVYGTEGRWQLFLTIPPAGGKFEGSGSQTEEEDSRAGAGATSAITWTLPRSEVTAGVETRWDRSNYENYFTTSRRRDSTAADVAGMQASGAPFIQSSFELTDRIRADVGARYDVLNTRSTPKDSSALSATHGVFSPKLGLIGRVSSSVSAYANASRGFRSTDGLIVDPTLAPITAWAYEGGVKVDHAGASASAALFRMDVSNEQTFDPVRLTTTNGGASRRQGVELEWRVPLASQTVALSGNWTFNDARYRSTVVVNDDGDAVPLSGLRVYNTSKYVGDVGARRRAARAAVAAAGERELGRSVFAVRRAGSGARRVRAGARERGVDVPAERGGGGGPERVRSRVSGGGGGRGRVAGGAEDAIRVGPG